jgi:hypothetical protein
MKPVKQLKQFYLMYPQAEVSKDGTMLYWETENGKRQHSISYYESINELYRERSMFSNSNDVIILDNYKFVSTCS